jgi:lipopolysaccharide transport system permease protein/teichoic acid transport system permease protein
MAYLGKLGKESHKKRYICLGYVEAGGHILLNLLLDSKKFLGMIIKKRSAIYELALRDFQAQNKNTYLGIIWGYIQPITYVILLVLVFKIGLRVNPGGDIPFEVYLITGMIAWQFFAANFGSLTSVIKINSSFVKKGDFSLSILHIAKILSSLVPHLVLLAVTIIVCWFYGHPPNIYNLQLIYYLGGLFFLLLGLGWITSSTSLFVQDIGNLVAIIAQFGFWFTPIVYNINRIPQKYQWIIKINPMCYVINGYRDSLIYKVPFWEKPLETLYFLCFTGVVLLIGILVFKKLKPHFGEVV